MCILELRKYDMWCGCGLQDEAFGDFVARVGFMALRQYAQGYVSADKSGSLASVSETCGYL
jgi:hypothetical protein